MRDSIFIRGDIDMPEAVTIAFVDGVSSISNHNNVHRIVCYKLNAAGQPEKSIELLIPAASISGFAGALSKLKS
jgi:predicted ATP-grasp superfamily ATP-dependent carboligase